MTTSEGIADQGWYLDSEVTHHLTNSVQNLTDGKVYFGLNSLLVGNGQGLLIIHIRYIYINTCFDICTHLNDVSCVPQIIKNVISVPKHLVDNNLIIEFTPNIFFLKDKVKGTQAAQRIVKDGLYKLLSQDECVSSSKL